MTRTFKLTQNIGSPKLWHYLFDCTVLRWPFHAHKKTKYNTQTTFRLTGHFRSKTFVFLCFHLSLVAWMLCCLKLWFQICCKRISCNNKIRSVWTQSIHNSIWALLTIVKLHWNDRMSESFSFTNSTYPSNKQLPEKLSLLNKTEKKFLHGEFPYKLLLSIAKSWCDHSFLNKNGKVFIGNVRVT